MSRAPRVALAVLLGACTEPRAPEAPALPAAPAVEGPAAPSLSPTAPVAARVAPPVESPAEQEGCEVAIDPAAATGYREFLARELTPAAMVDQVFDYPYPASIPPTRLRLRNLPEPQPFGLARLDLDESLTHLYTRELPALSADGEVVVAALQDEFPAHRQAGLKIAFFDARTGELLGLVAVPEGPRPRRGQEVAPRPCVGLAGVNHLLAAGRLRPLPRVLHAWFRSPIELIRQGVRVDPWATPPARELREDRDGAHAVAAEVRLRGARVELTLRHGEVRERFGFAARPWTETFIHASADGRVALAWSRFDVRGCGECNTEYDLRVVPLAAD